VPSVSKCGDNGPSSIIAISRRSAVQRVKKGPFLERKPVGVIRCDHAAV
jgi:hypothetical protein